MNYTETAPGESLKEFIHSYWKFEISAKFNNGGTMRFTTDFTVTDQWKGTGEYSRDGQNWMKVMETELTKMPD